MHAYAYRGFFLHNNFVFLQQSGTEMFLVTWLISTFQAFHFAMKVIANEAQSNMAGTNHVGGKCGVIYFVQPLYMQLKLLGDFVLKLSDLEGLSLPAWLFPTKIRWIMNHKTNWHRKIVSCSKECTSVRDNGKEYRSGYDISRWKWEFIWTGWACNSTVFTNPACNTPWISFTSDGSEQEDGS